MSVVSNETGFSANGSYVATAINGQDYARHQRLPQLPPTALFDPNQEHPAYDWRGFMLDSSRTFWPVETILELLELLHRYRFNKFHWHLTDNSGWRLNIPGYPRLLQIAAQLPRMPFSEYGNVPPDMLRAYKDRCRHQNNRGFYTDEDVQLIVERAGQLGIDVIPEIDLPGHMEAVIAAYPQLGNPEFDTLTSAARATGQSPYDREGNWPKIADKLLRNNLLWPSAEAFDFVQAALAKVVELFPYPVVHIGGDECDYCFWEESPSAQAWMRENSLADGPELQGVFMAKARQFLAEHGRSTGMWDEATQSKLNGDELIFGWREEGGVQAAMDSGHKWVFCDAKYLYLNRLASAETDEQIGMLPPMSCADILDFQLPDDTNLQGVQACAWCEFITTREELHYQIFPRLLVAAERAWSGNGLDRASASERIDRESTILKNSGFEHAFLKPNLR